MRRLLLTLVLLTGCSPQHPPVAVPPPTGPAGTPPVPPGIPLPCFQYNPTLPRPEVEVAYMTTRPEVVAAMLRLAGVKPGEVVYDLGCGDGRIPVAAVKQFGAARGLGIDFNADRIRDCERSVAAAGLTPEQAGRLMFKQGDVLKLTPGDFAEVDVVTLYLLSSVNDKLAPVLRKGLKPGARVVSNSFEMGDWKPDREEQVPTTIGPFRVMLWTIPSTK